MGVEIVEVRVDLVEAVVHEGGEGRDLLPHVDDHGGGGHLIDLVSGYKV